jgi:TonB-dependent starch-binding outer membrane protein SusC
MKRFLLTSGVIIAFLAGAAMAQERTISGKVAAQESGSPIPGVNVILKGTTDRYRDGYRRELQS